MLNPKKVMDEFEALDNRIRELRALAYPENIREKLAHYAHEAWSGWMCYLFEKSTHNDDGTITIPAWAVERWKRQTQTEYPDLPENEKESDRQEADKIIEIWRN